jgi:predicted GIY-YIG superfamily endonuclease
MEVVEKYTVYALACQDGCYYIGRVTGANAQIGSRFHEHKQGDGFGSAWTKLHPPEWIVEICENQDKYQEDVMVYRYVEKYGIDKVRGGTYCQCELSDSQIKELETKLKSVNDACYKCGRKGHFASQCRDRVAPDARGAQAQVEAATNSKRTNGSDVKQHSASHIKDKERKAKATTKSTQNKNDSHSAVCFRCGRASHLIADCYATKDATGKKIEDDARICGRCGRDSHTREKCYANKNVHGEELPPSYQPSRRKRKRQSNDADDGDQGDDSDDDDRCDADDDKQDKHGARGAGSSSNGRQRRQQHGGKPAKKVRRTSASATNQVDLFGKMASLSQRPSAQAVKKSILAKAESAANDLALFAVLGATAWVAGSALTSASRSLERILQLP